MMWLPWVVVHRIVPGNTLLVSMPADCWVGFSFRCQINQIRPPFRCCNKVTQSRTAWLHQIEGNSWLNRKRRKLYKLPDQFSDKRMDRRKKTLSASIQQHHHSQMPFKQTINSTTGAEDLIWILLSSGDGFALKIIFIIKKKLIHKRFQLYTYAANTSNKKKKENCVSETVK